MKHLDLFSGYAGFTIPAEMYGIETIGFSEIDKYANAVLNYHYPNIKNYGDITKIDFKQFHGKVDLVTGGSPCQDLSVAGKQAGLSGKRSGLFFDYIRAIKDAQPNYFIWENVKGALSSNGGWDFARVQIEMAQVGYDVQWVVYNAKDFGVPQNRERIFAIGTRKGCRREILPEPGNSGQDIEEDTGVAIYRGRPNMPYEKGKRTLRYERYDKEVPALTQNCASGDQMNMVAVDITRRASEMYRERKDGRMSAITATYYKGIGNAERPGVMVREATKKGYAEAKTGDSIDYPVPTSKARRGRVGRGVAQTLDTGVQQGTLDGMRIRRLTPTECERLMGLQDGHTAKGIIDDKEVEISDTQRYKMCGNGVVVNVVDFIYSRLFKSESK